jgi:hypothetical protein
MRGREYLELAREILLGATERHWRGTAGRAYYALMLECRDALSQWGFPVPPRQNVHTFVRLHFRYPADHGLKRIADVLERSVQLRNLADYELSPLPEFRSGARAAQIVQEVGTSLALLDAMDADPARRAAAIAAIRTAFP